MLFPQRMPGVNHVEMKELFSSATNFPARTPREETGFRLCCHGSLLFLAQRERCFTIYLNVNRTSCVNGRKIYSLVP
jgi:hypothetical protein